MLPKLLASDDCPHHNSSLCGNFLRFKYPETEIHSRVERIVRRRWCRLYFCTSEVANETTFQFHSAGYSARFDSHCGPELKSKLQFDPRFAQRRRAQAARAHERFL